MNNYKKDIVLKFIFSFMNNYRKWSVLSIFLSILSIAISLLQAHLMKKLIDTTVAGNWSWFIAINFLLLVLFSAAIAGLSKIYIGKLGANSIRDLKLMLSEKFINTEYKYTQDIASGDAVSTLNNDCDQISSFLSGDLISLPTQILQTISAFIYLLVLNPFLGLVTFAYTPIGMYLASRISKRLSSLYPTAADQKGYILNNIEQSLSSLKIIKSFGMYKLFMNRLNIYFEGLYKTDLKIKFWDTLMQPVCLTIANTPTLVFSIIGGLQALDGNLTLGTFAAITRLIGYIVPTTVMLPFALNNFNRVKASIRRVNRLIELPQEESSLNRRYSNLVPPSIAVKNLSFAYDDFLVLENITFNIEKPGITAVVGSSGGGKTTLLSLISGLYRPSSGSIYINKNDTTKLTNSDIGSFVSVLPQVIHVFSDSILNNIWLGRIDADKKMVIKAAELTGVSEFCKEKKEGYQTLVGQEGFELSGGQKQKLALARAYLKNTSIWLLDEPGSALDSISEEKLHKLLKKISKKNIVIIAAHRLSTIKLADKIIYLENGQIGGIGTWRELHQNENFINTINSKELRNDCEVDII